MAVVRFGHMWWSKKWLGVLDKSDYSNRLPRGERYARNGSAKTIDIEGSVINTKSFRALFKLEREADETGNNKIAGF